jgi:hypothetical protein
VNRAHQVLKANRAHQEKTVPLVNKVLKDYKDLPESLSTLN